MMYVGKLHWKCNVCIFYEVLWCQKEMLHFFFSAAILIISLLFQYIKKKWILYELF